MCQSAAMSHYFFCTQAADHRHELSFIDSINTTELYLPLISSLPSLPAVSSSALAGVCVSEQTLNFNYHSAVAPAQLSTEKLGQLFSERGGQSRLPLRYHIALHISTAVRARTSQDDFLGRQLEKFIIRMRDKKMS